MEEPSLPERTRTAAEAVDVTPRKTAVAGGKAGPPAEPPLASGLAERIAAGIAAGLAEAAKTDPARWAQVSEQELLLWIAEDTKAALAELAASGAQEDSR
ncbi:hypothetical protein SAMN05216553_10337 [Lentzea fradiae]|uniref:Uncharacterized protein n=1 Tax=Lentzea fradiae TaxID=200378 RepID=A0A1G7NKJ3_9PSEU|nr:hypothetical protein [Lentzea fradiae]SDF73809.1 hypothetical protein SAMN05216553_10337 [Lentzea fradiae]